MELSGQEKHVALERLMRRFPELRRELLIAYEKAWKMKSCQWRRQPQNNAMSIKKA
jgi:hypothetical protein